MGNKQSCCVYPGGRSRSGTSHKDSRDTPSVEAGSSNSCLCNVEPRASSDFFTLPAHNCFVCPTSTTCNISSRKCEYSDNFPISSKVLQQSVDEPQIKPYSAEYISLTYPRVRAVSAYPRSALSPDHFYSNFCQRPSVPAMSSRCGQTARNFQHEMTARYKHTRFSVPVSSNFSTPGGSDACFTSSLSPEALSSNTDCSVLTAEMLWREAEAYENKYARRLFWETNGSSVTSSQSTSTCLKCSADSASCCKAKDSILTQKRHSANLAAYYYVPDPLSFSFDRDDYSWAESNHNSQSNKRYRGTHVDKYRHSFDYNLSNNYNGTVFKPHEIVNVNNTSKYSSSHQPFSRNNPARFSVGQKFPSPKFNRSLSQPASISNFPSVFFKTISRFVPDSVINVSKSANDGSVAKQAVFYQSSESDIASSHSTLTRSEHKNAQIQNEAISDHNLENIVQVSNTFSHYNQPLNDSQHLSVKRLSCLPPIPINIDIESAIDVPDTLAHNNKSYSHNSKNALVDTYPVAPARSRSTTKIKAHGVNYLNDQSNSLTTCVFVAGDKTSNECNLSSRNSISCVPCSSVDVKAVSSDTRYNVSECRNQTSLTCRFQCPHPRASQTRSPPRCSSKNPSNLSSTSCPPPPPPFSFLVTPPPKHPFPAGPHSMTRQSAGSGGVSGDGRNGSGGGHHGVGGTDTASSVGDEAGAPNTNIQHISERELDDLDQDPSLHPTAGPLFLVKARQAQSQHNGIVRRRSRNELDNGRTLKKSSSCSTIYLDDSTVSLPNLKNTIKCVSFAIYYHIRNATSTNTLDIFDEKLHPLSREPVHPNYGTILPEHRHIYKFMRTLFSAAQLTAECAIITLVYLERLLTYAELELTPAGWKRILLGAIILASKVWDDQAVWNVDYCQILRDISVKDMNELERQYLVMIQFNTNVPASVYAKYYFSLRTLAEENELTFPAEPLSKERALKLEAMSRDCEDRYTALLQDSASMGKKWSSLDNVNANNRRSIAILS